VFAPNHRLQKAVTSLAIGHGGKRGDTATGGHASDDHATGGCCDATHATPKPRSHDWGELVQVRDERAVFQPSPDDLPAIDIHSL